MRRWRSRSELWTEIHGLRACVSATQKRANRLARRITLIDSTNARLRRQIVHDQRWMDLLETHVSPSLIDDLRREAREW